MSDSYGMGLADEAVEQATGYGFDLPAKGGNWEYTAPSADTTYGFDTPEGQVADDVDPISEQDAEADLWAIDHDADEQTIKDALPPVGDYEVQLQAGPLATKEVDGVKLPDQRYFGIGVKYSGEATHKARIRFSLCPRKFIKSNGRTHWAYLMYVSAGKAFLTAHERKHETYEELNEWLTSNVVRAYIGHTRDNDIITKEIKAGASSGVPF